MSDMYADRRSVSYIAGVTFSAGATAAMLVNGQWQKAVCTDLANQVYPVAVLPGAGVTAGDPALGVMAGEITYSGWTWTVGSWVYLDTSTPGGMTQTAPTISSTTYPQRIGIALSATTILVCPAITLDNAGSSSATPSAIFIELASSSLSPGATSYCAPGVSSFNGTESARQVVIPFACTIDKLYVKTTGAQPGDGACTVTVRKNGSDTTVVATITTSGAAGNYTDTSHTGTYAAGDLLSVKGVNASGSASATIGSISMRITPL